MRRAGLGDRRGLVKRTPIGERVQGWNGPERVGWVGRAGVARVRGAGWRGGVGCRWPGGVCRWPWAVGRGPLAVGRVAGEGGPPVVPGRDVRGTGEGAPPLVPGRADGGSARRLYWDVSGGSREARDGDRERAQAPRVEGPEVRWRGNRVAPKKKSRAPMVPP
jgi:hypothetical protein